MIVLRHIIAQSLLLKLNVLEMPHPHSNQAFRQCYCSAGYQRYDIRLMEIGREYKNKLETGICKPISRENSKNWHKTPKIIPNYINSTRQPPLVKVYQWKWETKMWCYCRVGMDGMMWLRMCMWNAMVHFPISTFQDCLITCVQGSLSANKISLNLHCNSR